MKYDSDDDLRKAIKDAGPKRVADRAGISPSTIYSFVDGKAKEQKSSTRDKMLKALRELEQEMSPDTVAVSDFITIPIFDIRASAGHGALALDEIPIGFQPFRPEELKRLTRSPHRALAVIQIAGDSMSPFLADGDLALVDTAVRKIGRDAIYVVSLGDDLVAKRCEIDIQTGNILVRSDNPSYLTKIVEEADRIDVKGRIVWIARALG